MTQQLQWIDHLNEIEPKFNEMAESHKAVRFKEECEFALQALNKNTALFACDVRTVQDAIKNVAAIGLTLNPAHGFSYLIPDTQKVGNNWVKVCRLSISFKGLMKLSTDSGAVEWVQAETVRKGDTFTFNGHGNKPTHSFDPFGGERGELTGVYCVAKLHGGDYLTEVMSWEEVLKIKAKAKTSKAWEEWVEEMAKKAVIKRAHKQWPTTSQDNRLATGVQVLNDGEGSREENYTTEQHEKYLMYLVEGTDIEFAAYIKELKEKNEAIVDDLYNSFDKGEKTTNKALHTKREMNGIRETLRICSDLANTDDDEVRESALDGLSDLEIIIIKKAMK